MVLIPRRTLLSGLVASLTTTTSGASASSEEWTSEELVVGGRRARLLVPVRSSALRRLLILLHGLGETKSPSLALKAWPELYGLFEAGERLRHPPVAALLPSPAVADVRLERIQRQLTQSAFEGMVVVCPVTPNPARQGERARFFNEYTTWLLKRLVPEVRRRVPTVEGRLGLDGCSMGGYVATEVMLRAPGALTTFGTVQSAIGQWRVASIVRRLQRLAGQRPQHLHIQTSTQDPFKKANEVLSRRLSEAGIANHYDVISGAHNQAWLRQIGTLEMLLWHDRML